MSTLSVHGSGRRFIEGYQATLVVRQQRPGTGGHHRGVATEENFVPGVRQRRAHHHELERQSGQQRDVQPGIRARRMHS